MGITVTNHKYFCRFEFTAFDRYAMEQPQYTNKTDDERNQLTG
jgi:hypothetical protein